MRPATGHRGFGADEFRDAQVIRMLRAGRYGLAQIRPVLEDLRRAGGTRALREAVARRHEELDRRTLAMLEGAGLLHGYLASEGPGSGGTA